MNFIDKIIDAGFSEQNRKYILKMFPGKQKNIPEYNSGNNWLGLDNYYPDAFFTKDGFNGELILSLQGMLMALQLNSLVIKQEDQVLIDNGEAKYICFIVNDKKLYETFSGELPPDDIVNYFIGLSNF